MRGYTHLASGIALGVLLYTNPVPIGLTVLGAVAPDMDAPYSLISKASKNGKKGNGLIKHRGILHTFTAAAAIYSAYFLIFKNNAILPFIWGYCLHIFLDSFTPMGVKPFYPLIKKKFVLTGGNIKTGSISDRALGIIFIILAIAVGYGKFIGKF